MKLYSFQEKAIKHGTDIIAEKPHVLFLCDEMGLGKTIQSICIADRLKSKNILVVCPASLKQNWKNELSKWLFSHKSILLLNGNSSFEVLANDIEKAVIINYDILTKWQDHLMAIDFDLVIADEFQAIKNPKAKRTLAFAKIAKKIQKKIFLSGTPILNTLADIYVPLKIAGLIDTNYYRFINDFCGAYKNRFGWQIPKKAPTHGIEAIKELTQPVTIRRQKADVLQDLPPKTRQTIVLDYSVENQRLDFELLQKIKNEQSKIDVVRLLSRRRIETAIKKIPSISDLVNQTYGKVAIFVHHKVVLERLLEVLPTKFIIVGKTPANKRVKIIDEFSKSSDQFIFLSLTACNTGLNITACSHAIFAELDWSPFNLLQAEDRIHRIGQKSACLIQYPVFLKSIDHHILKLCLQKLETSNFLTDSNSTILDDLITSI